MDIHRSRSGDEFILEKHELQQQCYEGKKREEKLKHYSSARTSPPPSSSSSTSSPSHEFSFTISLHRPSPSFAIDLSPADDIFFHGHLLPLHLISHYPSISPRSSTTSSDTVGLPIRELFDVDVDLKKKLPSSTSIAPSTRGSGSPVCVARVRSKPKYSFSLFRKWRRPLESTAGDHHKEEEERKKKKKARFDVGRALRRYVRVVRPLFLFRGGKEDKSVDLRLRPHSFSGNYSISRLKEWGERRRRSGGGGQFSAPASMRTSPTNSGLLVATATISSSNDSTMEELQSAIQAAIAHCKDSINAAKEDNVCKL